jgi:hypothetical protein
MIKELLIITILALLGFVKTEESFMKLRIYRELIEDLFSKNLNLIFSQLKPTISVKDVALPELNTALTNFNLQVTSTKEDDT